MVRSTTGAGLLAALLVLATLLSLPARAEQYETEIDVETEADLYDLHSEGQISDETLETLLELLRSGVDLSTATREELYVLPGVTYAQVESILEYRRLSGAITDPAMLVDAGIFTSDELQRLAPFLLVSERAAILPVGGRLQLHTRYAAEDRLAPPAMFRATMKLPYDLNAGLVMMSTRQRLGAVSYDPSAGRLVAQPSQYGLEVPKFYLRWKTPQRQVTAGTFRLGFGERLTLDNTRRQTPNGVVPDDIVYFNSDLGGLCRYSKTGGADDVCVDEDLGDVFVTRDFGWPDGFRGAAGSVEDLQLSDDARLALHGFGSYQARSVYQYRIYDASSCDDPRTEDCETLPVYEDSTSERRLKFATLPHLFDEVAGGGNATLILDERIRVGLTGYYAAPIWRVDGAQLDFQPSANYPFGGPFGAIGVFGSTVAGPFRLYAEGARSFDSMPNGNNGGFAAVQRTVYSIGKRELEGSLRYYDAGFANPYARPISASDMYEGQRARNEAGVRLRYLDRQHPDWRFRAQADLWTLPSAARFANEAASQGMTSVDLLARADFVGFRSMKFGGWVKHVNKDLQNNGRAHCYDKPGLVILEDENDETRLCRGSFYRATGRAEFSPMGRLLKFAVQYQHELVDDLRYGIGSERAPDGRFRQDFAAVAEVTSQPIPEVRLRLRTRYSDEDPTDDTYGERISWSYAEASWLPNKTFTARLRYDLFAMLDQRRATLARRPNPEHRLWLRLESRF